MRKFIFILSLWSASLSAADFPMVVDPVINATPPGAKVTAGYLTLINETSNNIVISNVYSPTISRVEIHLSSVKNDVASMEKQNSVSINAGGTLEFAHGSYHLMLMDLTEPLKENDIVDIILTTSAGDMLIEMPVKKIGMKMDGHENMHKAEHENAGDEKHSMGNHDTMQEGHDKDAN